MGVESDFTDEELKEFASFGVDLSAPGPAASDPEGAPAAPVTEPVVEPAPAAPGQEGPLRDPATGQFLPKDQQPAAPVADPNASPADPNAPPAAPDPNAPPPPPGFVPHAALHQERLLRQQAAQQLATLTARTNALLAAQSQPPAALPDLETDPVGYVRGLEERIASFETAQREEAQNNQVETAFRQEETIYETMQPDYPQASTHYVQSRAQELLAFYPPPEVQKMMMAEVRQIAKEAWTRGVPAPQLIYQLATARGYQPGVQPAPQPQPVAQVPQTPQPVLTAATPIPAAQPGTPAPAAVVAGVLAGQSAVRSLSAAAGATSAELNAQALLDMTDEEFENHLKLGQKGANARFAAIG